MESAAMRPNRGMTLAVGFGATTAMWLLCYIALMKPGAVIGEVIFVLTLAIIAAGGSIAGRNEAADKPGWLAGLKVGGVVALLNFLIVGALLVDPKTKQLQPNAAWWIIGNVIGSAALGAVGGVIGSMKRASRSAGAGALDSTGFKNLRCFGCGYDLRGRDPNAKCPECGRPVSDSMRAWSQSSPWFFRFLVVAAVTVLLLLVTGGLVTGLRAGLAVPDWPTSFGHNMLLYPLSEMSGGKYFEHAHRLYGMLVGVTAITVAASMFIFDRRPWMRILAVLYLAMVGLQGYLGGTRVTETSIALAIAHGIFGQLVFTTICCLAAMTSPRWKSGIGKASRPTAATDRMLTLVLAIAFLIQLGLGAAYRHLRREMNQPPEPLHALYTHIVFAAIVTLLVVFTASRAMSVNRDLPPLKRLGKGLMHSVGLQILLGVVAMMLVWGRKMETPIPTLEVVVTSMHQIVGAILLAFATMLALWTRRLLASDSGPKAA